ncbi:MAG: hypothetical protein KC910_02105 [Candidatus Eremiobacteraeota bacterium]|nr:hypothetical protein [Candidatus Eremiobacteraeota bacterium]
MRKILALIAVLGLSAGASADPFSGNVYGLYPEGVMVSGPQGSYLVPSTIATFEMGGTRLTYSQLQLDNPVQVIVAPEYLPQVVRIDDPYAWHVKHHPDHPHGGPPGLTGTAPGLQKQRVKMKGKGKHR